MTLEERMLHARIDSFAELAKFQIRGKTLAAYFWLHNWQPEIDEREIYNNNGGCAEL